ncbi:MAG: hypothetical protein JWM00_24 [Candidatus Saccharibacteria bacterium]|nr:hypothetical protein [Candidatus Saccharibacteria bacterium]
MFCINCFHENTSVTNSRGHKKQPSVWRRRACTECGTVFTTLEKPSLAQNTQVHTNHGTKEPFNLGQLIVSIADAFSHNPNEGKKYALWLAQTVETTLSTQHPALLTPEDIEATTHVVLKSFDEVAAIQYAAKHQLIISASIKRRGRPSLVSPVRPTDASPSR